MSAAAWQVTSPSRVTERMNWPAGQALVSGRWSSDELRIEVTGGREAAGAAERQQMPGARLP